jgi:hypothetical protein
MGLLIRGSSLTGNKSNALLYSALMSMEGKMLSKLIYFTPATRHASCAAGARGSKQILAGLPPHVRKEADGNTSSTDVPTIGRHGHG